MKAEMAAQPEVVEGLLSRRSEIVAATRAVVPSPLAGIVLIARGSSDYAATYGRYVLELAGGRPAALAAPSLHTLYSAGIDYRGYLAIAVSQSGRTPEIVTVLQEARAAGASCVAVTNHTDSPLGEVADAVVELGAGEERAVPATKTFTAQLTAFALMAEALGPVLWDERDWERVPESLAEIVVDVAPAQRMAEELVGIEGLISVARGFLYSAALEAALKLKEATHVLAQGYSAADLRHGPHAVIERGFPVLAFFVPGPAAPDMEQLCAWLREREARVFEVSEREDADMRLPPGLPEPLSVVPAAARAQQLAYELALRRGLDPDRPAGLSKVTLTS